LKAFSFYNIDHATYLSETYRQDELCIVRTDPEVSINIAYALYGRGDEEEAYDCPGTGFGKASTQRQRFQSQGVRRCVFVDVRYQRAANRDVQMAQRGTEGLECRG